jgi:hypothetical protein
MAMDIKRLRNFVTLAEAGSFRRASERLHLAQPALSVSIQKLEAELGTRLVDRARDAKEPRPFSCALSACDVRPAGRDADRHPVRGAQGHEKVERRKQPRPSGRQRERRSFS